MPAPEARAEQGLKPRPVAASGALARLLRGGEINTPNTRGALAVRLQERAYAVEKVQDCFTVDGGVCACLHARGEGLNVGEECGTIGRGGGGVHERNPMCPEGPGLRSSLRSPCKTLLGEPPKTPEISDLVYDGH